MGTHIEEAWEALGTPSRKFQPKPFYDEESDSITFYISDAPSHRKRIDPLVTLYISSETEEIVGCHLKFIKAILRTFDEFHVSISPSRLTIGLLLLAVPLTLVDHQKRPDPESYRRLIDPFASKAGNTRIPAFKHRETTPV